MERSLEDKVVIITGGAMGIGYEIADKFLQEKAKVVIILDLNEEQGLKAETCLNSKYGADKAVFYKCDVSEDLDSIYQTIINTYKYVDVLVNNAGIASELNVKKIVDINVLALITWSLKFWEHMRSDKKGRGGTIINMSSIYGYRVDPFLPVYKASKYAVIGFTKTLGHEYNYKRSGVKVVAICPGYTNTTLVSENNISDILDLSKELSEFMSEQLWQEPDAVARAAVNVFEKTKSGTAWVVEGAKPIFEV